MRFVIEHREALIYIVGMASPGHPNRQSRRASHTWSTNTARTMMIAFDLWSPADVRAQAAEILDRLRKGTMPCDGAWPREKTDVFERWAESGFQPERTEQHADSGDMPSGRGRRPIGVPAPASR